MSNCHRLDKIVGKIVKKYRLTLTRYMEESNMYWITDDFHGAIAIQDIDDNLILIKLMCEDISKKTKIVGLCPFSYYLKITSKIPEYSFELLWDIVSHSFFLDDVNMIDHCVKECLDAYELYKSKSKEVFPEVPYDLE